MTVVRDGQEAVDCLSGDCELPQLILRGLHLPRLRGLEVLQLLRSQARTRLLPVMVLTNSYVRKPIDYQVFTEIVKQLSDYWLGTNLPPPPVE